jgi:predicted O-linked N-acetylglucosamine transferase (SPINDLY family)
LSLLEEAVRLGPDNARLRGTLGMLLHHLQRPQEALPHARRAVELAPTIAFAHTQLADVLAACGDKGAAIASYRRGLELDPSNHEAHSNIILTMLTEPSYDAKATFAEARAWSKLHAEPLRKYVRPHQNDRDPERRLRIGYVSPDFRAHAIQQFLVPLFRNHDKAAFELFLYSSVAQPDQETAWYRTFAADNFRDIRPIDDVEAAEIVRRDRIDVLVDLAVHGPGHRLRLFACKPAPIQITWLGYAGTTGLDTIDYRITDPFFDPPGTDLGIYSEQSLHLPESFWCYDALQPDLPVGPLPALTNGTVTFGCQGSPHKLHAGVLSLWARVLREVPGSRLYLYAPHGREGVLQMLAAAGVEATRVEFGGRVSRREYLERYNRIDIGLDTFPFAGGTTSLDATWMGVPVVTLSGPPTLQRSGVSIAMNLGLPELVAHSEDDFVARAVDLARNLQRLSQLRAELRQRLEASCLGDAPRFTRQLEATYRTAWGRYCSGG